MMRRTTAGILLMALFAANPVNAAAPATGESFDSRFAAARSLALGGRRDAAIAAYTALLAESPGNSDVLVGRGRVHAWMDHWAEAEQDLTAATRAKPLYGDAWSALGDLYLWSDRPLLATEAYSRWINLVPEDGEAWAARGRAHRAANQRDAARLDFEAAGTRGIEVKSLLASLEPSSSQPAATVAEPTESQRAGSRPVEARIPDQYRWTAGLSIDREHFRGDGTNWIDSVASIRRQWNSFSLGLELLESRRFGFKDRAFALDGYVPLWPRAYANLRVQMADTGTLFPHNRWRAEVFQGVGSGWELSGGFDRLGFGNAVEILSAGLGRYTGNWYIRARYQYVPGTPNDRAASHSGRLTARYYYVGDADHYLELSGGSGHAEPSTTALPSSFLANRNSASFGIAWAGRLSASTGFKLAYGNGYGYESQASHNDGLSGSLYTRW